MGEGGELVGWSIYTCLYLISPVHTCLYLALTPCPWASPIPPCTPAGGWGWVTPTWAARAYGSKEVLAPRSQPQELLWRQGWCCMQRASGLI